MPLSILFWVLMLLWLALSVGARRCALPDVGAAGHFRLEGLRLCDHVSQRRNKKRRREGQIPDAHIELRRILLLAGLENTTAQRSRQAYRRFRSACSAASSFFSMRSI